jgi:hypothetical protein
MFFYNPYNDNSNIQPITFGCRVDAVRMQMPLDFLFRVEPVEANVALQRSVLRMRPHVRVQRLLLPERLRANRTRERPVSRPYFAQTRTDVGRIFLVASWNRVVGR